jgi:hypothetical protein
MKPKVRVATLISSQPLLGSVIQSKHVKEVKELLKCREFVQRVHILGARKSIKL